MTALRPPIPYYGSKTTLARTIAAHLPAHDHYIEPFAGSLAVLLAKAPAKLETVNDLDGNLVTFWRIVRDRPDELIRALELTPHARAELDLATDLDVADDLERARRVFVLLTQGRAGTLRPSTGWRRQIRRGGGAPLARTIATAIDRLQPAADRLINVAIEQRPAIELIDDYGTNPDATLYLDPPYLEGTRARNYALELTSAADHRAIAAAAHRAKAAVVLSGYRSPLYDELFGDWHRIELGATTTQGQTGDDARTEVLWLNRRPDNVLELA